MRLTKQQLNMLEILGAHVEYADEVWRVNGLNLVDNTVTLINQKHQVKHATIESIKVCDTAQK